MTTRALSDGERAIARGLFGDTLDPRPVLVHRARWWPLQPRNVVMAPNGEIWVPPAGGLWREDYACAEAGLAGLFVHELTHVWQHQQGIALPLARHPFCRYRYALTPGVALEHYGIEQQAEIVRHAWEGQVGRRPRDPALEALLPVAAARASG